MRTRRVPGSARSRACGSRRPRTGGTGAKNVITLTRLNGNHFVVNAELIRTIEERPDTTIVLTTGDTLIVKERMDEVVARAIEYGRMVRAFVP